MTSKTNVLQVAHTGTHTPTHERHTHTSIPRHTHTSTTTHTPQTPTRHTNTHLTHIHTSTPKYPHTYIHTHIPTHTTTQHIHTLCLYTSDTMMCSGATEVSVATATTTSDMRARLVTRTRSVLGRAEGAPGQEKGTRVTHTVRWSSAGRGRDKDMKGSNVTDVCKRHTHTHTEKPHMHRHTHYHITTVIHNSHNALAAETIHYTTHSHKQTHRTHNRSTNHTLHDTAAPRTWLHFRFLHRTSLFSWP